MLACATEREEELKSLGDEIAELSAHIQAATWRLLKLIREFDLRQGYCDFRSCAHWLNWRIGLSMGVAREKVRVAHALEELPLISEAFRRGEISYSKVRAMTRIASPAIEKDLVGIARDTTASQMERLVRYYRKADPAREKERAQRQHHGRYLRIHTDEEGMLVIRGRLPAEEGARVMKALELTSDELRAAERAEGDSAESGQFLGVSAETFSVDQPMCGAVRREPSPAQRRADALVLLAERGVKGDSEGGARGRPTEIVVHVAADVLADPAADGRSELEGGPTIAPETVRRLGCDASIVRITEGSSGEVRKTRSLSTPLRRALEARDRCCRFPGCSQSRFLQAHHIRHWADGGETGPENLVRLCSFHHRLVHEGNYCIEGDPVRGDLSFYRGDGRLVRTAPLPPRVPTDSPGELEAKNSAHGLRIDSRTNGVWTGMKPDWGMGVTGLLGKAYPETCGIVT